MNGRKNFPRGKEAKIVKPHFLNRESAMKRILLLSFVVCLGVCAHEGLGQSVKVGKIEDIKSEAKKVRPVVMRKPVAAETFAALAKNDPVNKQDLIKAGDKTSSSITFDDGGYLKMRGNASIQILDVDEIYLSAGEIFVNNKWNAKSGRRFKIQTKKITGGTTGTQFVMSYSEEEGTTQVFVFKGEVTLETTDPTVLRPDGILLKDAPLVVRQGNGALFAQDEVRTAPQEIFNQTRFELKNWAATVEPREGLTPEDLRDNRLINLGDSIDSNFVPGQDSRKAAEDATGGELAPPPPPPPNNK